MKKVSFHLMLIVLSAWAFTACSPEPEFDEVLLLGTWKSTIAPVTEYYRYDAMGTGVTWNTADDVQEEEGQAFSWTLDKSDLTQIHVMEIGGGKIPKVYTVTELTATSLKYKDSSKSYSFAKVK
ncbi:MAG: hypothetical protein KA206_08430 [Paludibacter sp.]|nr:hypothetical protein [Paludibacter sp.]